MVQWPKTLPNRLPNLAPRQTFSGVCEANVGNFFENDGNVVKGCSSGLAGHKRGSLKGLEGGSATTSPRKRLQGSAALPPAPACRRMDKPPRAWADQVGLGTDQLAGKADHRGDRRERTRRKRGEEESLERRSAPASSATAGLIACRNGLAGHHRGQVGHHPQARCVEPLGARISTLNQPVSLRHGGRPSGDLAAPESWNGPGHPRSPLFEQPRRSSWHGQYPGRSRRSHPLPRCSPERQPWPAANGPTQTARRCCWGAPLDRPAAGSRARKLSRPYQRQRRALRSPRAGMVDPAVLEKRNSRGRTSPARDQLPGSTLQIRRDVRSTPLTGPSNSERDLPPRAEGQVCRARTAPGAAQAPGAKHAGLAAGASQGMNPQELLDSVYGRIHPRVCTHRDRHTIGKALTHQPFSDSSSCRAAPLVRVS